MRIAAFLPELLRHLFKKPATVDYPFKKLEVPKDFRGTPYLQPELCIVCKACERDCPAEAIDVPAIDKEGLYKRALAKEELLRGQATTPAEAAAPAAKAPATVTAKPKAAPAAKPQAKKVQPKKKP